MPNQPSAPAPDAVAEIHEFMDRVREYGYACRFPLTNGGPATEEWNLEIIESLLTALAAERDRLQVENERMRPVVEAAVIYCAIPWNDDDVTEMLESAVDAYRASAPPDGDQEQAV